MNSLQIEDDFNWDNYDFNDFYNFFPCARLVLKFYKESQFGCKSEMRAFKDWVKLHWYNKECLHVEHRMWTNSDWTQFKRFIDNEYTDYLNDVRQGEDELHKDTFIRLVETDI